MHANHFSIKRSCFLWFKHISIFDSYHKRKNHHNKRIEMCIVYAYAHIWISGQCYQNKANNSKKDIKYAIENSGCFTRATVNCVHQFITSAGIYYFFNKHEASTINIQTYTPKHCWQCIIFVCTMYTSVYKCCIMFTNTCVANLKLLENNGTLLN